MVSVLDFAGWNWVLWVSTKTHTENIPGLYYQKHSIWANTLYSMGQTSLQVGNCGTCTYTAYKSTWQIMVISCSNWHSTTCWISYFSQLFGEEDPDQDVSPDTEDPEAAGGYTFSIVLLQNLCSLCLIVTEVCDVHLLVSRWCRTNCTAVWS